MFDICLNKIPGNHIITLCRKFQSFCRKKRSSDMADVSVTCRLGDVVELVMWIFLILQTASRLCNVTA